MNTQAKPTHKEINAKCAAARAQIVKALRDKGHKVEVKNNGFPHPYVSVDDLDYLGMYISGIFVERGFIITLTGEIEVSLIGTGSCRAKKFRSSAKGGLNIPGIVAAIEERIVDNRRQCEADKRKADRDKELDRQREELPRICPDAFAHASRWGVSDFGELKLTLNDLTPAQIKAVIEFVKAMANETTEQP